MFYREQQLQNTLGELGITFKEKDGKYQLSDEIKFRIATPRTEFVFKTDNFELKSLSEEVVINFPGMYFKTEAPFVDFIAKKEDENFIYVRLSNTKF
jgi:hypothetical protein